MVGGCSQKQLTIGARMTGTTLDVNAPAQAPLPGAEKWRRARYGLGLWFCVQCVSLLALGDDATALCIQAAFSAYKVCVRNCLPSLESFAWGETLQLMWPLS